MEKKKYFTYEQSATYPKLWVISPIHDEFPLTYTEGSYNVLPARLMGLSYAQYLRFCRDQLGAVIIGKRGGYPVAYFRRNDVLIQFTKLLNARVNFIKYDQEHPEREEDNEINNS